MTNVLLLRVPSQTQPDRFEKAFERLGYVPHSIPVMETVYVNLDHLERVVCAGHSGSAHPYDGVIATSARAAEAWREVVKLLHRTGPRPGPSVDWSSTPFYAVGEGTAKALASIRTECGDDDASSAFAPKDIRGATESGHGERLAQFILNDTHEQARRRNLLWLVGDKARDTLPNILKAGNVSLDTLRVYETKGSSRVSGMLDDLLGEGVNAATNPWWIVYFSPSSASFVTPFLCDHFKLPGLDAIQSGCIRVATIGPVTSVFLRDEMDLHVTVTASRPDPAVLAASIAEYDRENQGMETTSSNAQP